MTSATEQDLAFAHALADAADAITRAAFVKGGAIEHETKPDGTPVSRFDKAVERRLLEIISRDRPHDAVLGEEVGAHGEGRRQWVIDGIDGTSNFVTGSPLWGTLIALVVDGVPTLGVKSSPAQNRRWWAARGHGSWSKAFDATDAVRLEVAEEPRDRPIRANLEMAWEGHPLRPLIDGLAESSSRSR